MTAEPHAATMAKLRSSVLLALPFQVGSTLLAVGLALAGLPVQPWLAVLLVPAMAAPVLVELVLRTTLRWPLQLHYLIFITAGPFAGSALNLYGAIPEWDTWVHFDSGVMLAWLGMLLVRRAEGRTGVLLPVWFGASVVVMTPMAFAAAWEICEYASDILIGTVSQNGLEDTMTDIIAGTLGGLLAIGILSLTGRPRSLAPSSLLRERQRR